MRNLFLNVNIIGKYKLSFIKGLRIKEVKEVYEGEVTEMTPVETENPFGGKQNFNNKELNLKCIILNDNKVMESRFLM